MRGKGAKFVIRLDFGRKRPKRAILDCGNQPKNAGWQGKSGLPELTAPGSGAVNFDGYRTDTLVPTGTRL